jgi:RNA polymerase sigma factor (sigma-70 family)
MSRQRRSVRAAEFTLGNPSIRRYRSAAGTAMGLEGGLLSTPPRLRLGPMPVRDATSTALEGLVARFGGLLRQVGRRRGLTDAEAGELCQEVRIRIWHALASGERIAEAPASYVYRTAMSAALDMIRRRRARREEPLEDRRDSGDPVVAGVAVAPDCEGSLEEEELAHKIEGVVSHLAEPRDVVVRIYLAGYNHREIATLLGWTEAKARNLLYRGLADLRAKLIAVGIGPRGVS